MTNFAKLWGDNLETELKKAKIGYETFGLDSLTPAIKLLNDNFGLSETAKLELLSPSSKACSERHVGDYYDPVFLNEVFAGKSVYFAQKGGSTLQGSSRDRFFKLKGEDVSFCVNNILRSECLIFLEDASFVFIFHFSHCVAYDGLKNEFYLHADKVITDFYKPSIN